MLQEVPKKESLKTDFFFHKLSKRFESKTSHNLVY